jgi:hypothetical protein
MAAVFLELGETVDLADRRRQHFDDDRRPVRLVRIAERRRAIDGDVRPAG